MPARLIPRHRLRAVVIICAIVPTGCDQRSPSAAIGPTSAPQVGSDRLEASLAAVMQYLQSSEFVKAEAIARTLIDRAPNDARAHEALGQVLVEKSAQAEQRGELPAAVELRNQAWASYARAVELDPNSAGLRQSAGLIAMTAGETDAALRCFLKAEALDHSNAQHPLYAAQLLMQAKRLDEAEAALNRALAIAPDEPYVHASLAMVYLERSQMDAALREIQLARQADPDNVGFRAQQAKIHRRNNQPREALELLIGLGEPERAQEAAAFEIAAAYEALGEPAKAAAAWSLCFRANPRSPAAWKAATHAGELYLKAGDRPSAAQWASAAEQINPDAPEVKALLRAVRSP
jgi:tetratricopeptide (TPR) repeat protein